MSTKIERTIATTLFGQTAVKRKESAERDGSSDQKNPEQQKDPEQDGKEASPQPADRQSVEKAMTDLRAASGFNQTGMRVEVLDTKDGLRVRLAQANGAVVKVMSAEEFMKLRQNSEDGQAPRGKILDQKY